MSLFGTQSKPSLFGSTATQPQQGTGLGGSLFGQQQQQQQQQPAQQTGGLFGATMQPAQTGSLFGASAQPQQTSGLFGQSQQQPQQQQPQASVFGASALGQSQQQLPKLGSVWQQPTSAPGPREKPVTEQMMILLEKWNPESMNCVFQHYFYNSVPADRVPFYGPAPGEDEKKWEEALQKKPSESVVPALGRGFKDVAARLTIQTQAVNVLQQRLHEINDSLATIIRNHDLQISVRTAEARRRHLALSQRCLALATKVQVLRNRGYAMDTAEEELKKKLIQLEKRAFDPILGGRSEEIWARMSGVRARAELLQKESEKLGKSLTNEDDDVIDDETMKRIKKILNDYDSQLSYLKEELDRAKKDFQEWEVAATPSINGFKLGR